MSDASEHMPKLCLILGDPVKGGWRWSNLYVDSIATEKGQYCKAIIPGMFWASHSAWFNRKWKKKKKIPAEYNHYEGDIWPLLAAVGPV